MGILQEETKLKANISTDISLDLFLSSIGSNFLIGKAVEYLVEMGCNPQLDEHESILNAIYYLVGELEENHSHAADQWRKSPVLQYIASMLENKEN